MADEAKKEQNQSTVMPEEEIFKQRKDKLERLRKEEGYDPYKQDHWDVKHKLGYVIENYDQLKEDEWGTEEIQTAGRVMLLRRHAGELLQPLAYALIVGGALGNAIDRFHYGAVVDFLYFHIGHHGWPAFNVADSAICAGIALMVLIQLREPKKA